MARPRITATISGLPLTIYYEPGAQKTKPEVHYQLYPLSDENSRHILGNDVIVQLTWLSRKISRDVKPELLRCVANANAQHITSGIGRPRAKGRVELYEK